MHEKLAETIAQKYWQNRQNLGLRKYHCLLRQMIFCDRQVTLSEFDNYFGNLDTTTFVQEINELENDVIMRGDKDRQEIYLRHRGCIVAEQILIRGHYGKILFGLEPNYELLDKSIISKLNKDENAVAILSTSAVNALIYARKILNYRGIVTTNKLVEIGRMIPSTLINRKIYFYTHLVIAESLFYTQEVESAIAKILKQSLMDLEKMVVAYFGEVTVDAKLEFLLAAKMVGWVPSIFDEVMADIENKIRANGIVTDPKKGDSLVEAEHRNMLYLGLVKWRGAGRLVTKVISPYNNQI